MLVDLPETWLPRHQNKIEKMSELVFLYLTKYAPKIVYILITPDMDLKRVILVS